MSKFKIGEKVAFYKKHKKQISKLPLMTVQAIVKDGEMFPDGRKMNQTGKTLVITKSDSTNNCTDFAEDSLVSETEVLREQYNDICKKYKQALLKRIKETLAELTKDNATRRLDVSEYYFGECYERICKYCTPKDYPGNFCLTIFDIEKNKLSVTGLDVDNDDEYDFGEYDLEVEELAEINDLLDDLSESIENNEYTVDNDGNLNNTED